MKYDITEKFKNVSYANGKFLSDKSYAYDTIYFISKFIVDYREGMVFDAIKWSDVLEDYIAIKFQLLDKNIGILNYYHETINLLKYAKIIDVNYKKVNILDLDSLLFITKRMENAYIFLYILSYYTLLNSHCLNSYINFCNYQDPEEKKKQVMEIYNTLTNLNNSIKTPELDTQWALQNTEYILNILNFINQQPRITRTLQFTKNNIEMISVNVNGTKTKYPKKNDYLKEFDTNYVKNVLAKYLIKGED